jgi:hypothetical protein
MTFSGGAACRIIQINHHTYLIEETSAHLIADKRALAARLCVMKWPKKEKKKKRKKEWGQ